MVPAGSAPLWRRRSGTITDRQPPRHIPLPPLRAWIALAAAAVLLAGALGPLPAPARPATAEAVGDAARVPGQILVRLAAPREGLSTKALGARVAAVRTAAGASQAQALLPAQRLYRLSVPAGKEAAAVAALRARGDVVYAEPNYVLRVQALPAAPIAPDDLRYGEQWAPAKIRLPEAWGVTTGASSVRVAIVDTGVDGSHPEFAGRIVAAADCTGAVTACSAVTPNQSADGDGHGTHVAGIVGATGNNGAGIAGVGWGTSLVAVRVIDGVGNGTVANGVLGIDSAIAAGAKVINFSLGATASSAALNDAIDRAYAAGILVVVAAGNCGDSANYAENHCSTVNQAAWPAAYAAATTPQHLLPVAATDSADARAPFSNQSSYVGLGVSAPGDNILSTWPGNQYARLRGTSMAVPHVAGLASLVWSVNPSLTVDQVIALLKANVADLGAGGADTDFGAGRIDAALALQAAQGAAATVTATRTSTPTATATGTLQPSATATRTATPSPSPIVSATPIPISANLPATETPSPTAIAPPFTTTPTGTAAPPPPANSDEGGGGGGGGGGGSGGGSSAGSGAASKPASQTGQTVAASSANPATASSSADVVQLVGSSVVIRVPGRAAPVRIDAGTTPHVPDQWCQRTEIYRQYIRLEDVGIAGATFGLALDGALDWVPPEDAGCVDWSRVDASVNFTKDVIMQFRLVRPQPGALLWVLAGNASENGRLYEVDAGGIAHYVTLAYWQANQPHYQDVWKNVMPVHSNQTDDFRRRDLIGTDL
jgi:subtilisin family serine protease